MPLRLLALSASLALIAAASCDTSPAPLGCDGTPYPRASETPYTLPFAPGTRVPTGLANCSRSFHGAGEPDQYAYDFDMPVGTPFVAARAGRVHEVDEDESSDGGGPGNYVLIDHGDGTFAYYLHSPEDGIAVQVGDQVERGDVLGEVGRSGLAGYPHLHFIVVEGDPEYPYDGVPVSFSNASPADVPLRSHASYEALPY